MSAHVLLNLLNKLRKKDKMRGYAEHLISILKSFFAASFFNTINNTGAWVLDSI